MEKSIYEAEVLENIEIAKGIMKLTLRAEEAAAAAKPGQFINLYPKSERLILPRPISICDADAGEGTLTIVYDVVGRGTEEFSIYGNGEKVRISSPLGNGFLIDSYGDDVQEAVLVGGGIGTAPMVFLARRLTEMGIRCTAVTGFRKESFLEEELRHADCRVIITTDVPTEHSFVGTVVDCMTINEISSPLYFACGPRAMLSAVNDYVYGQNPEAELQVSMEERMGCGYGVCVGCVCDIKSRDASGSEIITKKKVCKDGPVFYGNEVVW